MKADVNEVTINGVSYVRKDSLSTTPEIVDNYVIVRTRSAGVHAGELVGKEEREVILKNARRLWYWMALHLYRSWQWKVLTSRTTVSFPVKLLK